MAEKLEFVAQLFAPQNRLFFIRFCSVNLFLMEGIKPFNFFGASECALSMRFQQNVMVEVLKSELKAPFLPNLAFY
jgi:hypothetical protein